MVGAVAALILLVLAFPVQAFEAMDQPRRIWPVAKLSFHRHLPAKLPQADTRSAGTALVVLLHGCGRLVGADQGIEFAQRRC